MKEYNPLIFRVVIGLMFIVAGFSKLTNIAMITGMLEGIGIPAAGATAWL